MPVTGSVHTPGKRWTGTGIFRFGCAQRNRFLATGSCFHNRITKYAPCGLRFLGESNLDFHLSRQFPVRLCTKPGPRSNTKQLFEHKNRFPLLEIGVLRHPVNGFERFSAVFSAECAHSPLHDFWPWFGPDLVENGITNLGIELVRLTLPLPSFGAPMLCRAGPSINTVSNTLNLAFSSRKQPPTKKVSLLRFRIEVSGFDF